MVKIFLAQEFVMRIDILRDVKMWEWKDEEHITLL